MSLDQAAGFLDISQNSSSEVWLDYATAMNSSRIHHFFVTETRITEAFITVTELSKTVLEY